MTSFELMVAKVCRSLVAIGLVITTMFVGVAQETEPVAPDASNANPLRGTETESTGAKEGETKNKQMVRGTKANEKPTGQTTIDFVIIGHEEEPTNSEASAMSAEDNKSEETSPKIATVLEVTSSSNQDEAIAVDEEDLHSEYERLHAGLPKLEDAIDYFVLGEDTDNPDFDSRSKATQKGPQSDAPAEMAEVLDTEAVMQLSENDIEFPAEDYPEESAEKPIDAKNDAGKRNLDNNEDADESEAIVVEDLKPNPLPVDVVSRPTLRRPKPINIEPLESQSSPTPVKVEVKAPVASATPPSAPPTSLPIAKVEPSRVIDAAAQYRLKRIEATLSHYMTNPESATVRSPWAVMHAILPYGADAELVFRNQRVNAIAWMCANRVCKTQTIFNHRMNAISPNVGGGVQGHDGQFLAILAQSGVSSQYPITVNQKRYTVADLVQFEMAHCKPKTELTFRLIGLGYYLGTKQSWRSRDRQVWNVERLLAEELAQPINGAACGGTHRLMGIYRALEQRKEENMPLTGKFAVAEKYIADYKEYAWTLQNPDGSFSTNWFESRAYENDDERKVQTTGHILEWLVYSSTAAELKNHRTEAAIDFLMSKIYDKKDYKWPIGPRGHALRAIALYREKAFGLEPITSSNAVAGVQQIDSNRR